MRVIMTNFCIVVENQLKLLTDYLSDIYLFEVTVSSSFIEGSARYFAHVRGSTSSAQRDWCTMILLFRDVSPKKGKNWLRLTRLDRITLRSGVSTQFVRTNRSSLGRLSMEHTTRYQLRHSPNRLNFRAVLLKESAASSDLVKKVLFDPQRDSGSYYA